ncbi:MAG: TolC family protein [Fimbriimonadaceae bacterium]|nr:TolC family protein [Fimbriimonadaceae bacterium]
MKSLAILSFVVVASPTWCQTLSLADALSQARANRGTVRAAELGVERARFESSARASNPPARLGMGWSNRPGLGATDQDLFLSQPIDAFGRGAAARQVGEAEVSLAEVERLEVLLRLQTDVLVAYFSAVAAARSSAVSDQISELVESLYRATVRKYEEGKVPETQVVRVGIERDRSRQAAEVERARLRASHQRLAGVVGASSPVGSVPADVRLPAVKSENVDRRPDLGVLLARVRLLEAGAKSHARSGTPEVELQGLRTPWAEGRADFGARLQMSWPVFDTKRRRQEAAALRTGLEAAKAQYQDAKNITVAELRAVTTEVASAEARVRSLSAVRDAARGLVERSQRGYTEGFGTLLDVLEATRSLREIEQELAGAILDQDLAEVARYAATGTLIEGTR